MSGCVFVIASTVVFVQQHAGNGWASCWKTQSHSLERVLGFHATHDHSPESTVHLRVVVMIFRFLVGMLVNVCARFFESNSQLRSSHCLHVPCVSVLFANSFAGVNEFEFLFPLRVRFNPSRFSHVEFCIF